MREAPARGLTKICASRAQTAPPADPQAKPPAFAAKQTGDAARPEAVGQTAHGANSDAEETRDKAAIERKLALVIPHAVFRGEPLSDALEYLRGEARRLDTTQSDPEYRCVNIFLKLPALTATAPASPAAARVTLDLTQRSLKEVLSAVDVQVGMKIKAERYSVSLVPSGEATDRLMTIQFNVAPAALGESETLAPGNRIDPRKWLEQRGVTFPPDASAAYLLGPQKLIVRKTRENVDRLKVLFQAK